ncbi:MAG: HEAT repeat domain-containing protein [Deltaproteobacteria bacterium]|nr:MAG: HEAT repeat domain-containing protein [Deltaproteobacteria bacterium]TMQ11610.1 MAG: HEAT repeat domain-containing protein [Deltaproteobacteria bacterium]
MSSSSITRRPNHRARSSIALRATEPRTTSTSVGAVIRAIAPSTRTLSITDIHGSLRRGAEGRRCRGRPPIPRSLQRVTLIDAMRALAVVAAWLLLGGAARADTVDTTIHQIADSSYKVRLAAVLALSKSHDPRAVNALAGVLRSDDESTIRRVAALALGKMIDARTPEDARDRGLDALAEAAAGDADLKVRTTAARAASDLAGLRHRKKEPHPAPDKPGVFVNVDSTTDQSKVAPSDAGERLARVVRKSVERTGYATTWPGGLPTQTELATNHARAFIVASTVKKIEFSKVSRQTQISCKVEIRVAPWSGVDGGEKWEANSAASASGSAKATTGNSDREIAGGVRDCLEAVAEDVTTRHILPFLKRLATAGS